MTENVNTTLPEDHGQLVQIAAEAVSLMGILQIPQDARGLVIIPHGIEDVDTVPHQKMVQLTRNFYQRGLATLLVDLFSSDELVFDQRTNFFRQNIEIMQQRLVGTAEWSLEKSAASNLSIGYFGLNVLAAAALAAAAARPDIAVAVVVGGSAMDLGWVDAPRVFAPTLLLGAEKDTVSVEQQKKLLTLLASEKKQSEMVSGVASLFESQDAFDEVVRLSSDWFSQRLVPII